MTSCSILSMAAILSGCFDLVFLQHHNLDRVFIAGLQSHAVSVEIVGCLDLSLVWVDSAWWHLLRILAGITVTVTSNVLVLSLGNAVLGGLEPLSTIQLSIHLYVGGINHGWTVRVEYNSSCPVCLEDWLLFSLEPLSIVELLGILLSWSHGLSQKVSSLNVLRRVKVDWMIRSIWICNVVSGSCLIKRSSLLMHRYISSLLIWEPVEETLVFVLLVLNWVSWRV